MRDDGSVNSVGDSPLLEHGETDELAAYLRSLAFRLLGSLGAADEVLTLTLRRLAEARPGSVIDERPWACTTLSRLSMVRLRERRPAARAGDPVTLDLDEPFDPVDPAGEADPAGLREGVGADLLAALDRLAPAERVAFVLHDLYDWHFEDVAGALGRTPVAARELAIRGRYAVRAGSDHEAADGGSGARARQGAVVGRVVAAAGAHDLAALRAALHPEVRLRADGAAIDLGAEAIVEGPEAVAAHLAEHVHDLRPALLDGYAAAVWREDEAERMVVGFTVEDALVHEIDLVADPAVLPLLDLAPPS